ncbi:MAG: IPExxxVDY family protein [Chitinophagales bacterium]
MPQKKHQLSLGLELEVPDFTLFGLVGNLKAIALAWKINQLLDIDFKLKGSIQLDNTKKASRSEHPYFYFYNETSMVSFCMFVNKDGKQSLLPELNTIDYLLKIEDHNEQIDAGEILSKLKEIQSINFALEIDPHKLKNQENLLIE